MTSIFYFILEFLAVILLTQQCISQPIEETVVSVYTTNPTTSGTKSPGGVYHQIATNIADRITSPIYKFLGINSTQPESTTRTLYNIQLQNDQDISNKDDIKPIDNDISKERDVEELSAEALSRKTEKKPEKITLYSSYLPILAKASETSSRSAQIEPKNDTWNELDDDFDWDSDEPASKPREGPLVYILEFLGSMIQLLWGGLMALFRPNSSSRSQ